jgi:hypothetical protein
VKQTQKWPKRVTEEMGPCSRQPPSWSDDRLTRLVQECVAQSDYRWQNRALAAWSRGEPLPKAESEENVLQACMNDAARTMVTENEALKTRLTEVTSDREALRADEEKNREYLRSSNGRLADALGEAAKKPAGSAVATATSTSTSDGSANTQSDSTSQPGSVGIVPLPGTPQHTVPAPKPTRLNGPKKVTPAATPGACQPAPVPQKVGVTEAMATPPPPKPETSPKPQ